MLTSPTPTTARSTPGTADRNPADPRPTPPARPPRDVVRRSIEAPAFDASSWQLILQQVRANYPGLNRVWFDQMIPRQLTNGVIQVTIATPGQLNFCQGQCQQPFTIAAQAVTGRLIAVSFH